MSQKQFIKKELYDCGEVSRNSCLRRIPAITRLGAIMCQLKKEGVDFKTFSRDGDYIYKLCKAPQTFNKEKELENLIHVENMKFEKTPTLYHKQKLEGSAWQCIHAPRHRKTQTMIDFDNDTSIDVEVCSACGKTF